MDNRQKSLRIFLFLSVIIFIIPSLACLGSAATATPTATKEVKTTPYSETKEADVNVEGAPIRSGPGKNFEQLGTLKKNTRVKITAISSDENWFRIEKPAGLDNKGKETWISVLYVSVLIPTIPPMPQMPGQVP